MAEHDLVLICTVEHKYISIVWAGSTQSARQEKDGQRILGSSLYIAYMTVYETASKVYY